MNKIVSWNYLERDRTTCKQMEFLNIPDHRFANFDLHGLIRYCKVENCGISVILPKFCHNYTCIRQINDPSWQVESNLITVSFVVFVRARPKLVHLY